MFLDISHALRSPGEQFPFTHRESLAAQDICGETVTFDAPVQLSGNYFVSGDSLVLRGNVLATARSRCTNCLEPAMHHVSVDFDEVFIRADKNINETEEDTDRFVFNGTQVELNQFALTLVLLDLPLRFLCKPDCKGLLPASTNSRSEEQLDSQNNAFSALKKVFQTKQEV